MTVQHRKDGRGIGPSHAGRPSREGGMHMQAGVVYSNPNARIHGDQLLGLCIMICSGLHSVLYVLSGGRRSLMISSSHQSWHSGAYKTATGYSAGGTSSADPNSNHRHRHHICRASLVVKSSLERHQFISSTFWYPFISVDICVYISLQSALTMTPQ